MIKKKILKVFILAILLIFVSVIYINASSNKKKATEAIVIDEDYSKCTELDITNWELENYLNSIEDEEKRELLKTFFYYPINPEVENPVDKNLDILEQAKLMSDFSLEELQKIVDEIKKEKENKN